MNESESAIDGGAHEEQLDSQPLATLKRKDSQTASEWVNSQLQLEADAREALPYSFDHCTQHLGSIRQNIFACLTCNPPPDSPSDAFNPAGLCYGCSIACHGEHTLVEIFARRNFTCDCGTTRFPASSPCTLRINPATGTKGGVHSQEPAASNDYNQNFQNKFCGCGDWYDAEKQKGTMYQCLGLASEKDGGCGEDWWHPECLVGLPKDWYLKKERRNETKQEGKKEDGDVKTEVLVKADEQGEGAEHPVPPGFPDEDDFETLVCYKCVNATPWIKDYADSPGFMTVTRKTSDDQEEEVKPSIEDSKPTAEDSKPTLEESKTTTDSAIKREPSEPAPSSLKRTLEDTEREDTPSKKTKLEDSDSTSTFQPKHMLLPPAPGGEYSMLATSEDFRDRLCRCASCYPQLSKYPQLLEEEETYQPPLSEEGAGDGNGSVGTGSLLDRGEAALSNVDRVRAIEGVMVYNHLKDKVKTFLQPFAESGQAVGAEDIKAYFEKLRGDAEAIKAAGSAAAGEDGGGDGENRKEQSGY